MAENNAAVDAGDAGGGSEKPHVQDMESAALKRAEADAAFPSRKKKGGSGAGGGTPQADAKTRDAASQAF